MKNINCPLFLTLLFLVSAGKKSYTQSFEPIFEDADGKTSIIAPKGFFGLNTANSSIRFQYFYSKSASPDPKNRALIEKWNRFYGGVNVTGSADGGIVNLFSEGNFNPGTSADLFLGHRSLFFGTLDRSDRKGETAKYYFGDKKITIQDWLTLRSGVKAAKYKLYNVARPFNDQISTEFFRGYLVQLAYTLLFNGATSVGVSWDVSKVNNIDNLIPTKFKEQTIITDPSGQITRTFDKEVNAYTGAYNASVARTYSMDVVQLLTPNSGTAKYAFHVFGRYVQSDEEPIYKTGVGFYVFPKGKLFGGVFAESNDLTNRISGTPDFLKRVNIGLTVKYVLPSLGSIGE